MALDIKQIFIDAFLHFFEHILWFLPIVFIIVLYLFFFRNEIAYDWELTNREKNKLSEKSLLGIIVITVATIAYLYIKEHIFLLAIVLSIILTYFLYLIGFVDMIYEKLENRNDKW